MKNLNSLLEKRWEQPCWIMKSGWNIQILKIKKSHFGNDGAWSVRIDNLRKALKESWFGDMMLTGGGSIMNFYNILVQKEGDYEKLFKLLRKYEEN